MQMNTEFSMREEISEMIAFLHELSERGIKAVEQKKPTPEQMRMFWRVIDGGKHERI